MSTEKTIALIVDCDNASSVAIYGIMDELAKYGITNIRKAYGNWKGSNCWEEVLHPFAILPVQQFPYTKGKNATDIAISIDVMELLYTEMVDIFALVSSDSDFTPLAMKLRSKGKYVIGFGEQKTPEPFIDACNSFIYIDKFKRPTDSESALDKIERWNKQKLRGHAKLMNAMRNAIEEEKEDDGWALAADVSQNINRKISLSPKNFGYSKWLSVVRATEYFEESKRENQIAFRLKEKAKPAQG